LKIPLHGLRKSKTIATKISKWFCAELNRIYVNRQVEREFLELSVLPKVKNLPQSMDLMHTLNAQQKDYKRMRC
jgi:hypothetical protein